VKDIRYAQHVQQTARTSISVSEIITTAQHYRNASTITVIIIIIIRLLLMWLLLTTGSSETVMKAVYQSYTL